MYYGCLETLIAIWYLTLCVKRLKKHKFQHTFPEDEGNSILLLSLYSEMSMSIVKNRNTKQMFVDSSLTSSSLIPLGSIRPHAERRSRQTFCGLSRCTFFALNGRIVSALTLDHSKKPSITRQVTEMKKCFVTRPPFLSDLITFEMDRARQPTVSCRSLYLSSGFAELCMRRIAVRQAPWERINKRWTSKDGEKQRQNELRDCPRRFWAICSPARDRDASIQIKAHVALANIKLLRKRCRIQYKIDL